MHSQAALENWRKTTRQKKMSKRKWVILEKIIYIIKNFYLSDKPIWSGFKRR